MLGSIRQIHNDFHRSYLKLHISIMTLLRNIGVTDYIGNVQLVVVLIPSFIPRAGNVITTDYHRGITRLSTFIIYLVLNKGNLHI
jgi:hypothetical protein